MVSKKTATPAAKSSRSPAKTPAAKRGGAVFGAGRGKPSTKAASAVKAVKTTAKTANRSDNTSVNELPKKDKVFRAKATAPAITSDNTVALKKNGSDEETLLDKKVVQDSFTMLADDYDKIDALKKKCLAAGIVAKKSELLRAGLAALETLSTENLVRTVGAVKTIKTGQPVSDRKQKSKADKKQEGLA